MRQGESRYGTPEPQIALRFPKGTSYRIVKVALHKLATDVELATPANESWCVNTRPRRRTEGRISTSARRGRGKKSGAPLAQAPYGIMVVLPSQTRAERRSRGVLDAREQMKAAQLHEKLIQATLAEIIEFIGAGKLSLQVRTVLPLSRAAEAHRLLEGRKTTSKGVLQLWVDA